MLIKVFGNWVNADHIVSVRQYSEGMSPSLMTFIALRHGHIDVKDKTSDEVAEEINN